MNLLDIHGVSKTYPQEGGGVLRAVSEVSLHIEANEVVGLVGESGCGKSTLGKMVCALTRPTAGHIVLDGVRLDRLSGRALRRVRPDVQMIFQHPHASLDPRLTVRETLAEAIRARRPLKGTDLRQRIFELLYEVGLASEHLLAYPHELSGGQCQRLAIARALATEPKLVVADEPVSALDVSIQSHIINLLGRLCRDHGLTMLLISHDLAVVHHLADRIAVMYLGRVVELGTAESVMTHSLHPYTKALVSAMPVPDPDVESKRQRILLAGEPPSPVRMPPGCPFHPRCPRAAACCAEELPALQSLDDADHVVACHRAGAFSRG